MRQFIRQLKCFWYGHPAYPTGRNAVLLYEVVCRRCFGRYVANPQQPGVLLPADEDFDRFVSDVAEYQRLHG